MSPRQGADLAIMPAHNSSAPRVVLTGGGTGGHVYPALAVAEAISQIAPKAQLLYVGGDRMEARTVPAAGLPFRRISVHGLAGRGVSLGRRLRSLVELALGLPLIQSLLILRSFGPDVVLGTGGYVSGPVLVAARLMGVPSAALDGNRVPGHTSRIVARLVDVMLVAHDELGSTSPLAYARERGWRSRACRYGQRSRARPGSRELRRSAWTRL